jgi:hypothetical protein
VLEDTKGIGWANSSRVAPSVLESYRIGGQNEIADRIYAGDSIPGAFYGGALEGAEPEGRTKVEKHVAGGKGAGECLDRELKAVSATKLKRTDRGLSHKEGQLAAASPSRFKQPGPRSEGGLPSDPSIKRIEICGRP